MFFEQGVSPEWKRVVVVHDAASGLRALIVVHSTARGPALGGIRRLRYASEAEAFADARRLAEAMSFKCALAELAAGGGKAVILDHPGLDLAAAYSALGQAIDELGGLYVAGPDVGTSDAHMDQVRAQTRWVNPANNNAGESTAASVLAGLRGVSEVVFGDTKLGGRRYVIQGLGSVGLALAKALVEAGGSVAGWDVDPGALERAKAMGVEALNPADWPIEREPCDVFMPCALGQTLDRATCEAASWQAVCGPANNQLVDAEAGAVLHRRGIAWAPDFVINAGAVIEGVETILGEPEGVRARVDASIGAIQGRCVDLLETSRKRDLPVAQVAFERARALLASEGA